MVIIDNINTVLGRFNDEDHLESYQYDFGKGHRVEFPKPIFNDPTTNFPDGSRIVLNLRRLM
jgi:hypothetical protein